MSHSAPNPEVHPEAERLLQALQQLDPSRLRDYHGNADERLQKLMVLRFEATSAIADAIERLEVEPTRKELVQALYRVQGVVKDPASIPWLRKKLASPHRADVLEHWLLQWHSFVGIGFGNNEGYGEWPWLTGRERWLEFLIETYAGEPSVDHRLLLLNILKGFDDVQVSAFFRELVNETPSPGETLLTEAYLVQHGDTPDADRIGGAVAALAPDRDNHDLLIGTADALRHEAFVSYLIETWDVASPNVYPRDHDSRIMLEKLTYASGPDSADAWRAWYAAHRDETRAQWVAAALTGFRTLRERDPAAARTAFEKLVYRWNDVAAIPLIQELLPDPAYRSVIAGWINLTYTPSLRSELAPLAREIANDPNALEDWARALLQERGFLATDPPQTWADYVRWSNMRP